MLFPACCVSRLTHELEGVNSFSEINSNINPISSWTSLADTLAKSSHSISEKIDDFLEQVPQEDKSEKSKYSQTSILNPYKDLIAKFEILSDEKPTIKAYKITLKDSRELVLKILIVKANATTNLDTAIREFYISRTLSSLGIINFIKIFDMKQISLKATGETRIEILLEYGGRDLSKIEPHLTLDEILKIEFQLLYALCVFEEIGIAHFDIKPQNMVYNRSNSILKLIDFGAAISFFRSPKNLVKILGKNSSKFCGFTEKYAPPEIIQFYEQKKEEKMKHPKENKKSELLKKSLIPQKVDVFCFGLTIAELILQNYGLKIPDSRNSIWSSHIIFIENIEMEFKKVGLEKHFNIIKGCLNYNPEVRPTFSMVRSDLLDLFSKDPEYSIIADLFEKNTANIGLEKISDLMWNLNEYEAVIYHTSKFIELMTKNNVNNNVDVALIIQGNAYREVSQNDLALKSFCRAEILRRNNKLSLGYANVLSNIGQTNYAMGNYETAIEFYKESLEIRKKCFKDENKEFYRVYDDFGTAYSALGKYEDSISYYKKSIKIQKDIDENENLDLAKTYNNLGTAYFSYEKFEKAINSFKKSRKIMIDLNKKKHPIYAEVYKNIASSYDMLGKHAQAERYYSKIINFLKGAYGEDHTKVASAYSSLGEHYLSLGMYEESIKIHKKALKIRKKEFGKNHIDVAESYHCLGTVYRIICKDELALDYFNRSLNIKIEILGKQHDDVAKEYSGLGLMYSAINENKKSLECHNKAMSILIKIFGEDHENLATTYNNLGLVYDNLSQYDDAINCLSKAIKLYKRKYGEEHQFIAASYVNIGLVYQSLKNFGCACENFIKAANIYAKRCGEKHPDLANAYFNLGGTYYFMRRVEISVFYFLKSEKIYQKTIKNDDPRMIHLNEALADAFYDLGNEEKSEEYENKIPNDK